MKNPARWLIALALCACALAWWWKRPPPEPVFEGRRLSQWLRAGNGRNPQGEMLSSQQIQSLGPATAKWLAYTAEHGELPLRESGRIKQFFAHLRGLDFVSTAPPDYNERLLAIVMLGKMRVAAKPAIPTLCRTLHEGSYERMGASAVALHNIGPTSWPVVDDQLKNGSNLTRCFLIISIWQRLDKENDHVSVDDANKVFILLTNALHDPDPMIWHNAALSLGQAMTFAFYREVSWSLVDDAAAALWRLNDDEGSHSILFSKEQVLRYYRESKLESISRLTPLLTDPDEAKRNLARAVLDQLAKP